MSEDAESNARARLQRIAFGRADSPAQQRAAQDALEELVARDAAVAEASRAMDAPQPEPVAQEQVEAEVEPSDRPGTRPRSLVALLVVIGLFAGGVAGVLIAHGQSGVVDPISADATGSTPLPVPTADAGAALKSLLIPQTKADTQFPLKSAASSLDIQPASIHRIMTNADGATLWTARTGNDICMMWTAPGRADGNDSDFGCATPSAFANGGLRLTEGLTTWTWDGSTFTTTRTN
jgi:hypothetical protein